MSRDLGGSCFGGDVGDATATLRGPDPESRKLHP